MRKMIQNVLPPEPSRIEISNLFMFAPCHPPSPNPKFNVYQKSSRLNPQPRIVKSRRNIELEITDKSVVYLNQISLQE